mmetsp:Transcript_23503/g.61818  ORF Transcript_23503/g.61818 Transcript_23503/m.61818 type:complete len:505 (-) Transcript_23503:62-1576(-)
MDGRCDLILLGWAFFVGFNLASDFMWSRDAQSLDDEATPDLHRGEYNTFNSSGAFVERGDLKLKLTSGQTGIDLVRISLVSMTLIAEGKTASWSDYAHMASSDFLFNAVKLDSVGQVTATGVTNPTRFKEWGPLSCRLDGVFDMKGAMELPFLASEDDKSDRWRSWGEPTGAYTVGGKVTATECGFALTFVARPVDTVYITQKVVRYSIWANLITILQIRFFLAQMRHTEDGPSASKVSVLCIAMQALTDFYDSFLHLGLGLSSMSIFSTIAVVALFKFILFALLEARYLLTIWRHRRQAFDRDVARIELLWLYSRFYGALIVGLMFIYKFQSRLDLFILSTQVFWIPQIVHDAWEGTRNAVCPTFMIGISATRLLYFLYFFACPAGIFSSDMFHQLPGAPSLHVSIALVVIHATQVSVMLLQKFLGPRWFVPWVCMPRAYNYGRRTQVDRGTDCVICMAELDPEDPQLAVSPCNHVFHRGCLLQWMEVKLECPTCRAALPPLQ